MAAFSQQAVGCMKQPAAFVLLADAPMMCYYDSVVNSLPHTEETDMAQETENSLQELKNDPVLKHFLKICEYPHPSHHEQALSDYLLGWGKAQGLECMRGRELEVYLRRPASPGYEKQPPILLQAHMDMVCEKAPGVQQDFDHDPVPVMREGDLLTTGGKTTLGADNGLGVALAMAALTEDIPHPELEVLFTTAEEDDFAGAKAAQGNWFHARRMINLDNSVENEIIVGSSGGSGMEFTLPAPQTEVPGGWGGVEIELQGLAGGHSGEDIHKGRGCANVLLARFLAGALELGLRLADVRGGTFRVALTRSSRALAALPAENLPALQAMAAQFEKELRAEYQSTAPHLTLTAVQADCPPKAATQADTERFVRAMLLLPSGIKEMNGAYHEVVEASCNLGEVYQKESGFTVIAEVRAAHDSTLEWQLTQCRMAAALLGAKVRLFGDYPGWAPNPDSVMLHLAKQKMKDEFGTAPTVRAVHAGLESGAMMRAIPGLDAISMGAAHWGLHSPGETASIPSVGRTWRVLQAILAAKE